MAKGMKAQSIKDSSGIVAGLIDSLASRGSARLAHFGLFRVRLIKGGKRYSFKERKIVPVKPYKQITFTPAKGVHEMLRSGKMAASK